MSLIIKIIAPPPVWIHTHMSWGSPAEIHVLFISLIKSVEVNERRNNLDKISVKIALMQKIGWPSFIYLHPLLGSMSIYI